MPGIGFAVGGAPGVGVAAGAAACATCIESSSATAAPAIAARDRWIVFMTGSQYAGRSVRREVPEPDLVVRLIHTQFVARDALDVAVHKDDIDLVLLVPIQLRQLRLPTLQDRGSVGDDDD